MIKPLFSNRLLQKTSSFRSIGRIWGSLNNAPSILDNLASQAQLLHAIRSSLPKNLAPHCVSAQIRNKELILHTATSAWAARLRYLAPNILAYLGNEFGEISQTVKVRVAQHLPTTPKKSSAPKTTPRLSNKVATSLQIAAMSAELPRLRQALSRLADHGQKENH